MPILAVYLAGLAYVITGDSVAARDPRRFWWALLLWFIFAPAGWLNSAMNRV
jgi:hypothetical protein